MTPTQGSRLRRYERRLERSEKKLQVIALGRLRWPLRRIEQETGVRRETAGAYVSESGRDRSAGTATAGKTGQRWSGDHRVGRSRTGRSAPTQPNPNPENLPSKGKARTKTAKPANDGAVTTGLGAPLIFISASPRRPVPKPRSDVLGLGFQRPVAGWRRCSC